MNWDFDTARAERIKALLNAKDPRTGIPYFLLRPSPLGNLPQSFPTAVQPPEAMSLLLDAWPPAQSR